MRPKAIKITKTDSSILKADKVIAGYLYESDFCQVKNWVYNFAHERNISKGYNDCFCIVFVRNGDFLFDLAKQSYDMHTGHIVIDKPDYEYRLRPAAGQCSIINFSNEFYKQYIDDLNLKHSFFFANSSILSLALKSTPEIEYLHYQILMKCTSASKLEVDNMVMEMLRHITALITTSPFDELSTAGLKKIHFTVVERAKEYINENFAADISLHQVSEYACTSAFHFSRIFKQFTDYSPHQYLLNIRLKHGEMLLKNTRMTISDIAIQCGFSSPEYFATAFRQVHKVSPVKYRQLCS